MNDVKKSAVESCSETCRVDAACHLDYAVNEYQILCYGYDIHFEDSWYYLIEALQNPWTDKTVKYSDSSSVGATN